MAVPRPTSPLIRSLSVAGAVALLVGLSAGSGQAVPGTPSPAPTTAAQATTQLKAFNEQFEKVTEQYNDARILLGKRTAQAKTAQAKATASAKQVQAFRVRIKQLVSSESRSDPFGTFGAMLSSGSPGDFAAQASIMNVVSSRRSAVLTEATKASTAAAKAAADARAAQAAATKVTKDLEAKRTDLSRRATQSKALLDRLTASERRAYLDSQNAAPAPAPGRASRDESRTAEPQQQAPPEVDIPAGGGAATAIAAARSKLGSPYVWAAAGPSTFDCSGLTMYAWGKAGRSLPHSSAMQMGSGTRVSVSSMQPGDLVFYGSPVHHVALYVGGGQVIHAPQSGDVVRYASVNMMSITGVTRP